MKLLALTASYWRLHVGHLQRVHHRGGVHAVHARMRAVRAGCLGSGPWAVEPSGLDGDESCTLHACSDVRATALVGLRVLWHGCLSYDSSLAWRINPVRALAKNSAAGRCLSLRMGGMYDSFRKPWAVERE